MQLKTFISTWTLENYLYHIIATSTVNSEVIKPDLTPSVIVEYFAALSYRQGCHIADLTLLGISASVLLEIFHLSWLRREILSASSDATLWHAARSGGPKLHAKSAEMLVSSRFLDVLYTHAYFLFRSLLLDQVTIFDEPLASQYEYEYDRLELEEAVHFVCSRQEPYHVVAWPLLIVGLSSGPGDLRESIEEGFRRLVDNSRLASAASSLEIMKTAWRTHTGLSILLSSNLKGSLVF